MFTLCLLLNLTVSVLLYQLQECNRHAESCVTDALRRWADNRQPHLSSRPGFYLGPLVDGKVIRKAPASAGVKVPSSFGSTTSEGMLFVLGTYLAKQTQETYNDFLSYQFGPLASRANSTYPTSEFPPTASVPGSADTAMGATYTDYASGVRLTEAFRGLSPTGFLLLLIRLPVFPLVLG